MGSGPILLVQWTLLLFSLQEACAMMRSGQEGMFTTRPPKLWTLSARLALSSLEILTGIEIWLTVEACRICWGTPIVKAKARSSKQVVQWYSNGKQKETCSHPAPPWKREPPKSWNMQSQLTEALETRLVCITCSTWIRMWWHCSHSDSFAAVLITFLARGAMQRQINEVQLQFSTLPFIFSCLL